MLALSVAILLTEIGTGMVAKPKDN
jgi:hypothetical protein